MKKIEMFLEERKERGLLRELRPFSFKIQGKIYTDEGVFIDFSSNDYLGLSSHPYLIEKVREAVAMFGTCSSASRLLGGDFQIHHRLEERVARFKGKESAVVFNTGYQANIGILSSLLSTQDVVFADKACHASIIDGIILSGSKLFRFRHNDTNHLESLLKQKRKQYKTSMIITETIFSMDGDRADLKNIVSLKNRYDSYLMVDEAHSTGIYGRNGSGMIEEEGLCSDVELIMGTFSKALAGYGGYLATSKKIANYIINTSRSFIYSTALPPFISACNLAGLDLIEKEPERRKTVLELSDFLRESLKTKGYKIIGNSQIVPLITGDNTNTQKTASLLLENGFWVFSVRPPTVPEGTSRIRFSITYHHKKQDLQKIISLIN